MEENQELLRGKQSEWHKRVKAQVFRDEGDEYITVKKIGEKVNNMKKCWKEAKAMQECSGWGVRSNDNEKSINEHLEQKCAFF